MQQWICKPTVIQVWRLLALAAVVITTLGIAGENKLSAQQIQVDLRTRFQAPNDETPDFQKHIVPLFSRLGCNGRACHGSFQGRGGFQLSLFGYDFEADHGALFDKESPRIDLEKPLQSLIISKPIDEDEHEGGQRYEEDGWEYHVLKQWIEQGAERTETLHKLSALKVEPAEIQFSKSGEDVQLRVVAQWADGSQEDVTPLCRFQSNDEQIATIDPDGRVEGVNPGASHVVVFYDKAVIPVPVHRPVSEQVGENYPDTPTPTKIDQHVVGQLKKLGIVQSPLSDDATFLRRVRLDMTGTLPTPTEVTEFLADTSEDKRDRKIEELLESPAYAAWWTTKLCDFTGNNSQQLNNTLPIQNQASQDWYDWIYKRVSENEPYDELVAGIVTATSLQEGQTYQDYSEQMCSIYREDSDQEFADLPSMTHFWSRRDFRDAESRAINFAYAFMGVRIQCAQCHKHPFDQWSKQDFDEFTKFFGSVVFDQTGRQMHQQEYAGLVKDLGVDGKQRGNQLRREFGKLIGQGKTVPMPVVAVRPQRARRRGRNQRPEPAPESIQVLGEVELNLKGVTDVRQPLMEWLRGEDNPYFARAFVNRVWASYFGVGIVEPADDLNLANPPSNGPLLEYLERGFVESGFDMKWLHREIASSRTYQLDWRTNETNQLDERNFSHAYLRRMPAEVVLDAIVQSSAGRQELEGFENNFEKRTIALAGTQLPRGQQAKQFALQVFGRSTRESNCDCDRSEEVTLLQTVYLQNDQDIHFVLKRRGGWLNEAVGIVPIANQRAVNQQIQNVRKRVGDLYKQLQKAKKAGEENRVKQLNRQIEFMRDRIEVLRGNKLPPSEDGEEAEQPDVDELISQAYLRTLNRFPDPNERARCQAYFADSANPGKGLEGVLWALLNTKEFRVIH